MKCLGIVTSLVFLGTAGTLVAQSTTQGKGKGAATTSSSVSEFDLHAQRVELERARQWVQQEKARQEGLREIWVSGIADQKKEQWGLLGRSVAPYAIGLTQVGSGIMDIALTAAPKQIQLSWEAGKAAGGVLDSHWRGEEAARAGNAIQFGAALADSTFAKGIGSAVKGLDAAKQDNVGDAAKEFADFGFTIADHVAEAAMKEGYKWAGTASSLAKSGSMALSGLEIHSGLQKTSETGSEFSRMSGMVDSNISTFERRIAEKDARIGDLQRFDSLLQQEQTRLDEFDRQGGGGSPFGSPGGSSLVVNPEFSRSSGTLGGEDPSKAYERYRSEYEQYRQEYENYRVNYDQYANQGSEFWKGLGDALVAGASAYANYQQTQANLLNQQQQPLTVPPLSSLPMTPSLPAVEKKAQDHCSKGYFVCPNGNPWPKCTHPEKYDCPPPEYAHEKKPGS